LAALGKISFAGMEFGGPRKGKGWLIAAVVLLFVAPRIWCVGYATGVQENSLPGISSTIEQEFRPFVVNPR